MTDHLRTYVVAVADGEGPPSEKQWAKIVYLARSEFSPLSQSLPVGVAAGERSRFSLDALREAMEARGETDYGLAVKAGVGASYIRDIFRGKVKSPTFDKLARLASALEVSVDSLSEVASARDDERARVTEWVRVGLSAPGRSQSGLARHLNIDQSAVNRLVKGTRGVKAEEVPLIQSYFAATAV